VAYTGSSTPNVGTTSTATLSRDIHVDTLLAYNRKTTFMDKIYTQTIQGGTGAQFTIEGKEDTDSTGTATYSAGTQVNITAGTQDQRVINLDRPTYVARRIDKFDEAVSNYDVMAMQVRQIGSKLANVIDRKISAAIEAASLATGLVGNGNGTVVVNTALPGGAAAATTAEGLGNEIIESIYAAVAAIRGKDNMDDVYVAMSPTNFQYLPQSLKIVSNDYTGGNGGLDSGMVAMVGGAKVFETNNLPTTAGLIALAFTDQAAGMVKLWDVNTKISEQPDFLDAKLITAYFSNGVGSLRPDAAVSIKNV
jgi:hypothetical protein